MAESLQSVGWRWLANLAPAYRATGARVVYIADDFKEVQIRLALSWRTRNHLNMIWGGALFGALDPVFGVMLHKLLGPGYYVVDKEASIHFKRPGLTTVHARFAIDDAELQAIKGVLQTQDKTDRIYRVELTDTAGQVCVVCDKTVHIRRSSPRRSPP